MRHDHEKTDADRHQRPRAQSLCGSLRASGCLVLTSNGLQRLIVACVDDECTLRQETSKVDEWRQHVLSRIASERLQFAVRLRAMGEPGVHASRSWSSFLRQFARRVRVIAGGPNRGDAIAECRRSRDRTEAMYDKAVKLPWPGQVLPTLMDQRERIRREREELIALQF